MRLRNGGGPARQSWKRRTGDRTRKTAEAVATDIRYGVPLGRPVDICDGDYSDLDGADAVLITSGVNEKTGGATDRNDPQGRLKLLDKNAEIYRDIVPKIVDAAPRAVLVVVTDPPDPSPMSRGVHERTPSFSVPAPTLIPNDFACTWANTLVSIRLTSRPW